MMMMMMVAMVMIVFVVVLMLLIVDVMIFVFYGASGSICPGFEFCLGGVSVDKASSITSVNLAEN